MLISAVWIAYIAYEVQKRQRIEDFGAKSEESHKQSTRTPAYIPSALKNTKYMSSGPKFWRASLYQYGVDLYGKSAIILPPIIMDIPVTSQECQAVLGTIPVMQSESPSLLDPRHMKTVSWFEFHMLTIMLMSCGMLTVVVAFLCYVFCCNGKSVDRVEARTTTQYASKFSQPPSADLPSPSFQ